MSNDALKTGTAVECQVCDRTFDKRGTKAANESSLRYHMQTHKEASLACPGCKRLYRHVSAVSMHFESGFCKGCRGKFNARQKMFDFARNSQHLRQYLADPPSLQYAGNIPDIAPVPEFPYKCPNCFRKFHQQSQMYQHMFAKHPDTEEMKVEVVEKKPTVKTYRAVLKKKESSPPDVELDRFTQSNIEIMNRRTKKFGTISSPVVGKVRESEAKVKRRERFGVISEEELDPKKNWVKRIKEDTSKDLDGKMEKRKKRFADENMRRRMERFADEEMFKLKESSAEKDTYMEMLANIFEQ